MSPSTYIAIDLETTGLSGGEDEIIEVGIVTINRGSITDEWSSLVNPGVELPSFITSLTGITQNMVDKAPSFQLLRQEISRRIGDHTLVGHNISFDLEFLYAKNLAMTNKRLDTLTLASILLPFEGRYSLAALTSSLDLDSAKDATEHRARADARRTAELFLHLTDQAAKLDFTILDEITRTGRLAAWPEASFFEDALRVVGRRAFTSPPRPLKLFQQPKLPNLSLHPVEKPEAIDQEAVAGFLLPGGPFSQTFDGFEHRPQQIEMLEAVAQALNQGQHLLVEAGTGTGKSLGYLLPAVFWADKNERRVVISTNTINLQDQLLGKDIPELQRILPFEFRAAVLKGKRNYLCTRMFQQLRHSGTSNFDEMTLYARILVWLPRSKTGDVSEISLRTPGERMAWARLNAENDACTTDKCSTEGCPLHAARKKAEQAHILVVNHALLLADVASENRVLPEYADLIVDEAHHLEDAVTNGLSFQADKRFLEALLDEVNSPRSGLIADLQRRMSSALPGDLLAMIEGRIDRLRSEGFRAATRLEEFFEALSYFVKLSEGSSGRYAFQHRLTASVRNQSEFEMLADSWDNLGKLMQLMGEEVNKLAGAVADSSEAYDVEDSEDLRLSLTSLSRRIGETANQLDYMFSDPHENMIYWIEQFRNRISLHAAPLDIGPLVETHIFNSKEAVILTSATLRTSESGYDQDPSFSYLRDRLHAQHAEELAVGSPFDYEQSTLVYLPTDMPEPNQPGYQRYVEKAIADVATALNGRTLALFTSFSQLSATAEAIGPKLSRAGIQILAQGEGVSRQQLLAQFKSGQSPSILLGTRSFWEGVDVPGDALQAVIIAKFPFDVPSDPIFAARSETFENSFFEYSIPEAVLRFRQGFGRLIRRKDDKGIVVVLDKRILSKRYGQAFLHALPECTVIRQRTDRLGELTARWINR